MTDSAPDKKLDALINKPQTPIRRALISVSDKAGIVEFAKELAAMDVAILSTGGTARVLRDAGLTITDVSDHTGFPEMMDGRVKTLHPKIHGGLLFLRDNPGHVRQAEEHGIPPIDLVCVNLYPFEKTVAEPDVSPEDAIEQIDIGGPSMVRSAAKNWQAVAIVTDPRDYERVVEEMRRNDHALSGRTRFQLAKKAFARTAAYDAAISAYLNRLADDAFPETITFSATRAATLRYGENPHQAAAFYVDAASTESSIAHAESLGGKALSYNNFVDAEGAWELVKDFSDPTAAVIKHTNPCGCATADTIEDAMLAAYDGDPVSAFGGIVALNRKLTVPIAEFLASPGHFFEVIIAPGLEDGALEILRTKPKWGKNVRVLDTGKWDGTRDAREQVVRKLVGGWLVADRDLAVPADADISIVTKRVPTESEMADLLFAQTCAKHVKSNAIVLVKDRKLIGVGAGQMSRVDAARLAVEKAGGNVDGAVAASDAFFPFPDAMLECVDAGATAIIQPGGSRRDAEVIAAADERGVAMVVTGTRHFKH